MNLDRGKELWTKWSNPRNTLGFQIGDRGACFAKAILFRPTTGFLAVFQFHPQQFE
jgi:hypothetical protein